MDQRHYLAPLFDPTSVLVVHRDEPPKGWREAMYQELRGCGIPVHFCAVGSHRDEREKIDASIDLGVIDVRADQVERALKIVGYAGAKAAILLLRPSEHQGREAWMEVARRFGMRLLGPGRFGFQRPARRLNIGRAGPLAVAGNVAVVSQSGALSASIVDWAGDTSIGFSLIVALGAEIDVELPDVLDFLANDGRTRAVVVYLGAVQRSRAFMSALRSLATIKPVVVLRGGRSDWPPHQALTHSGAICGSDAVYAAALRRAGAVQINLFTQMFTAARYLATRHWPIGKRLALISNGYGPAVLGIDQAVLRRVTVEGLSKQSVAAIAAALPGVKPGNPLILDIDANPDQWERAVRAIAADSSVDAILALLVPGLGIDGDGITDRIARIAPTLSRPLFACWLGDTAARERRQRLDRAGIPVFRTPEAAVDAYLNVATFHDNQLLLQQMPGSLSGESAPDLEGARALVAGVLTRGRTVMTERESKSLLEAFEIPVTRAYLAESVAQAEDIAAGIGYPVVLKIASVDITHKSDVGGVVLDVRNSAELGVQYERILESVRAAAPEARIAGVTVQAMCQVRTGRELYVGVMTHPLFGPVIAFGAGGTMIEWMRNATLEFPPLNRFLARRMIERTGVARLLGEFRGAPPADIAAIETILMRVSEMVCEIPVIAQMDINPIIVDVDGAVAVDARVVLSKGHEAAVGRGRYAHMAILPYPAHMVRELALRDGKSCRLRPIRAEDAEALQQHMRSLSEQSRYFRFISTISELSPKMMARYTQIDYDRELALVAVIGADGTVSAPPAGVPERIIGVVRYLLNPDRETCEFAVAISDAYQGFGLGSQMMKALIEAASDKGLRQMQGVVLRANRAMLGLMRHLEFQVTPDPDDPTLWLVAKDLGEPEKGKPEPGKAEPGKPEPGKPEPGKPRRAAPVSRRGGRK